MHNVPAYPVGPCDCGVAAQRLAEIFHITYEARAPLYGYVTRKDSRVEWKDVPEANKALMISVCQDLLANKIVTLRSDLLETN